MMALKLAIVNARKYSRDDNIDMLKSLQEKHGNDIFLEIKEDTKETCLFGAGPKATKFLLELGLDPTLENYKGETAITYAAKYASNPTHYQSLKVLAEVNSTARELLEKFNSMKDIKDPITKLQDDIIELHKKLDLLITLVQTHISIHPDKA